MQILPKIPIVEQRLCWNDGRYKADRGRTESESEKTYFRDYISITINKYKGLIIKYGFKCFGLLWYSYIQTGFMGVKLKTFAVRLEKI